MLICLGGQSLVAHAEEDPVEEDLLEDEEDGEATVESEDEQGDEEMAVTDTDTEAEGVSTAAQLDIYFRISLHSTHPPIPQQYFLLLLCHRDVLIGPVWKFYSHHFTSQHIDVKEKLK